MRHSIVNKSINVFLTDANIIITQTVNQFIVRSFCESNNSTIEHFNISSFRQFQYWSTRIDNIDFITIFYLQAISSKQTKAKTSYFIQFVNRSKSISNLTFLSCQQSTFISFEQSSEYVHVIIFESFEFRFLSLCFSFESFILLLFIIDLSFHDSVIKSSWFQSIQLI